jgi:hypothetical protein
MRRGKGGEESVPWVDKEHSIDSDEYNHNNNNVAHSLVLQ